MLIGKQTKAAFKNMNFKINTWNKATNVIHFSLKLNDNTCQITADAKIGSTYMIETCCKIKVSLNIKYKILNVSQIK